MTNPGIPYESCILEDLQDDEYAVEYLNQALADDDPRLFLLALRRLAKARDIQEALYQAVSETGNPDWSTLHTLLKTLGFGLQATRKTA